MEDTTAKHSGNIQSKLVFFFLPLLFLATEQRDDAIRVPESVESSEPAALINNIRQCVSLINLFHSQSKRCFRAQILQPTKHGEQFGIIGHQTLERSSGTSAFSKICIYSTASLMCKEFKLKDVKLSQISSRKANRCSATCNS